MSIIVAFCFVQAAVLIFFFALGEYYKEDIEKYHDYIGVANEMDDFMVYAQKNIKKLTKKLKKNI